MPDRRAATIRNILKQISNNNGFSTVYYFFILYINGFYLPILVVNYKD